LFETSRYFPIIANTTIQSIAIPGAIDIFKISGNGAFYNNYVVGTFKSLDISVGGNPLLYNLSNSVVSTVTGYYTDCLLYITSGNAQGQYISITNYNSNSLGNIITLANPLFPIPTNNTAYTIYPQVSVVSSGTQSINCVAQALINSLASNSVYRIEVLDAGAEYQYIANSSISVNAVVGVTNNAVIRAILGPNGGHGSNVLFRIVFKLSGDIGYVS
jgi:hypothetical protein